MPGEENLIPFDKRTEDEQRKIRAAGGRASGVSRRRKRSLKDAADLFLSLPVSDVAERNRLSMKGIDPDDIDNQMAIIVGLSAAAAEGDSKAAKVLFELLGEDKTVPAEKTEDDALSRSLEELAQELESDD